MKKLTLLLVVMLFSVALYSQTFKSSFVILQKNEFESEMKNRIITISDKEISISNFGSGTETIYFIVNKTEEAEDVLDGHRKYYYCIARDKDPINGYQKATICKTAKNIILLLFATPIDVYYYSYSIN